MNDQPETAYDHDDWLLVARHVNPEITDAEFDAMWVEFVETLRRREMH